MLEKWSLFTTKFGKMMWFLIAKPFVLFASKLKYFLTHKHVLELFLLRLSAMAEY